MVEVTDGPFELALRAAMDRYNALTPDQQAEMWQAQRESWARGMAPCEHGDPDWETCPKCLSKLGGDDGTD